MKIKSILKYFSVVFVYLIITIFASTLLPFSTSFKVNSATQDPTLSLVTSLILACWVAGAICIIVQNAKCKRISLFLSTVFSVFGILSFMTQIETLIFSFAFKNLSDWDIIMIIISGLLPVAGATIVAITLYKPNNKVNEVYSFHIPSLLSILAINGVIYMVIYFAFGYFVAWQSSELRLFYSGSKELVSFFEKLKDNFQETPMIYPFQWLRGVLFSVFILALFRMHWKKTSSLIVSVFLIFLGTAVMLIIPNFLFPDAVRWAHFAEMLTSMALFSLITIVLLNRCVKHKHTHDKLS